MNPSGAHSIKKALNGFETAFKNSPPQETEESPQNHFSTNNHCVSSEVISSTSKEPNFFNLSTSGSTSSTSTIVSAKSALSSSCNSSVNASPSKSALTTTESAKQHSNHNDCQFGKASPTEILKNSRINNSNEYSVINEKDEALTKTSKSDEKNKTNRSFSITETSNDRTDHLENEGSPNQYYQNYSDSVDSSASDSNNFKKSSDYKSKSKNQIQYEKLDFSLKKRELQDEVNNFSENLSKSDSFDHILAQQYTDTYKDSKFGWKPDYIWPEGNESIQNQTDASLWKKNSTVYHQYKSSENNFNNNNVNQKNYDNNGTLLEQLIAAKMAIDKNHSTEDSDEFVSNEYYSDAMGQSVDLKRERFPAPPLGKLIDPEHYGINLTIRGDLVVASDVPEWEFPDIDKLKSLRDKLIQFMSDNHLKQADICRFTGLGAPYLSFMVKDPTISNFSSKRRVEVYSVLTAFFRKIESKEITLDDISRLVLLSKATARASNSKKRVSGSVVTDNERSTLIRRRRRGRVQTLTGLRDSSLLTNPMDSNQFQYDDFSPRQNHIRLKKQNQNWQQKPINLETSKNLSRLLLGNFQNIKDNYSSILQQTADIVNSSQHVEQKSNQSDAFVQAFLSFLYRGYMPQLSHLSDLLKKNSLQQFVQAEAQNLEDMKILSDSNNLNNKSPDDIFNAIAENFLSSTDKKFPPSYDAFMQSKEHIQTDKQQKNMYSQYSVAPSTSSCINNNISKSLPSIISHPVYNQSPKISNLDALKTLPFSPTKNNNECIIEDSSSPIDNLRQRSHKMSTPIICVASECSTQPINSSWYQTGKQRKNSEVKTNDIENSSAELTSETISNDHAKQKKEPSFHKLVKCTPHVTKPVVLSLDRAPPIMNLLRPKLAEFTANQPNSSTYSSTSQYSNSQLSDSGAQHNSINVITQINCNQANNSQQFSSQHNLVTLQNSRQSNPQYNNNQTPNTNGSQGGQPSSSQMPASQHYNLIKNNFQSQFQDSGRQLVSTIQSVITQNNKLSASEPTQKVNPEIRFGKNWLSQVDLKISAGSQVNESEPSNLRMYFEDTEDLENGSSHTVLPNTGKICPIRLQWKHGSSNGDEDVLWDMNETGNAIETFIETYCRDMHLPLTPYSAELVKEFRKQLDAAKTFDSLFQAITQHLASRLRQKQLRVLPGMSRKILLDCYRGGLRIIDVIPWNLCSTASDAKNLSKKLTSEMCLPPSFLSTIFPALLRAVAKEKMKFVYECLELLKYTLHEDITLSQSFGLEVVSEGKKRQPTSPSPIEGSSEKKPKNLEQIHEYEQKSDTRHFTRPNSPITETAASSTIDLLSAVFSNIPELADSLINNSSKNDFSDSKITEAGLNNISKEETKAKLIKSISETFSASERYLNCHEDASLLKQMDLRTPIILRNTHPTVSISKHMLENALNTESFTKPTSDVMYIDSSQDLLDTCRFRRQKIS